MQPMMAPPPVPQTQQTTTVTTTTTQDMGADGKPGTTWSRNSCCFIFLIILTIVFAFSSVGMNNAMNNSIRVAANRDEVYAVIGKDQLCDNPLKIADTISGTYKGKCVDFKAKWHIKNEVQVRSSAGFRDDVIDAKCTETKVYTEMYVEYETCRKTSDNRHRAAEIEEEEEKLTKDERAISNCNRGDKNCRCTQHKAWKTDVQGLSEQPYVFDFPTRNGGGTQTFDGDADNAVLKRTEGHATVEQKVTAELKQEAIRQQGKEPLTFGNTGKTEVCLTHAGGAHYKGNGFYAYEIYNGNSYRWANCAVPHAGDYRISATCHGPPSTSDVRVIGGLDAAGDRLGGFSPDKGVSSKNKEKILIWDIDLNADNNQIVEKHQKWERVESDIKIARQRTWRNVLAVLAIVMILVISYMCIYA